MGDEKGVMGSVHVAQLMSSVGLLSEFAVTNRIRIKEFGISAIKNPDGIGAVAFMLEFDDGSEMGPVLSPVDAMAIARRLMTAAGEAERGEFDFEAKEGLQN
jgi:hypothetical protein